MSNLPVATQWLLNATAPNAQQTVPSVVMVIGRATGLKGTGWVCSDNHIVTNEHVVRGNNAADLEILFPTGQMLIPIQEVHDNCVDLAALTMPGPLPQAALKVDASTIEVGTRLCIWGHPLGYNGPPPLLTVGYLSGFSAFPKPNGGFLKRLILNAAVNPGNSGGPVAAWGESSVRGVVFAKHAPIPNHLLSIIDAMSQQTSGMQYNATDASGTTVSYSEAQLVADVLRYFREMTQVVIGEAVSAEDLIDFLNAHSVPWKRA